MFGKNDLSEPDVNDPRLSDPLNSITQTDLMKKEYTQSRNEFDHIVKGSKDTFLNKSNNSIFIMNPKLKVPVVQLTLYILNYMYHHDDDVLDVDEKSQLHKYIDNRRSKLNNVQYSKLKRISFQTIEFGEIYELITTYQIPLKAVENVLGTVSFYLNYNLKYSEIFKGQYLELTAI